MEIKTKLSIGDPIVVIALLTEEVKKECSVCKGKKTIILEGKSYECPECYGRGYKIKVEPKCWRVWVSEFTPTIGNVARIDVEIKSKKKIDIRYFPWRTSGNYFHEEDCFSSLKEAQAECDRRNNQ